MRIWCRYEWKMRKIFRGFLDSFKLDKDFGYTFLADAVTFSLIFTAFTLFASYIQEKSVGIMQGRSIEEIQQLAASGTEQLLPFLTEVRSFLFWSLAALLFLVIASFCLYSYSQAVIWNHLENKKVSRKTYWRWNALNLVLLLPIAGFSIVYLIAKIFLLLAIDFIYGWFPIFYVTHASLMDSVRMAVTGIVGFYLILVFMLLILFIYHGFSKKYKVWEAVSSGFILLKQKGRKALILLLFAVGTAEILTLLTSLLRQPLMYTTPLAAAIVNIILVASFLAWLRLYVFKTLLHEYG